MNFDELFDKYFKIDFVEMATRGVFRDFYITEHELYGYEL